MKSYDLMRLEASPMEFKNNIQYIAPPPSVLGSDPGAAIERGAIISFLIQLGSNHSLGSLTPQLPKGAGDYVTMVMRGQVQTSPAISTGGLGLGTTRSTYAPDFKPTITIDYWASRPAVREFGLTTRLFDDGRFDYGRAITTPVPKTEYFSGTSSEISYK